jgi:hypothetical protein
MVSCYPTTSESAESYPLIHQPGDCAKANVFALPYLGRHLAESREISYA